MSLWGPRSFKPPHLPSGEKSYKQHQKEAQVARTQGILVVALKKEEPRYVTWWLYRNKISKMNKKQEEVRMEHGEPHLAPVYHPKKKNSGLVLREEKHRRTSSTHDQPQSVQRLFQVFSEAKTIFTTMPRHQLPLPQCYYLL